MADHIFVTFFCMQLGGRKEDEGSGFGFVGIEYRMIWM
jgi:hypothetical protein